MHQDQIHGVLHRRRCDIVAHLSPLSSAVEQACARPAFDTAWRLSYPRLGSLPGGRILPTAGNVEALLGDRATVVRTAPTRFVAGLSLSAEEGFVLSRVERPAPLRDVLSACGLPDARAMEVVRSLVAKGALLLSAAERPAAPAAGAAAEKATAPKAPARAAPRWEGFVFNPAEINEPDVDLDLDQRKEILWSFHNRGVVSLYRLLGLDPTASADDIRKAFNEASRRFHPDSFFRKRLGEYHYRIEAVFQTLKEARDTLLDDEKRRAYDRAAERFTAREREAVALDEVRRLEDEERGRLRRDMMLRSRGFGRLTKARQQLQAAEKKMGDGSVGEAAHLLQRAVDLDPRLDAAKARLDELRKRANADQAAQALDAAHHAAVSGRYQEVTELLQRAVRLDPDNAIAHEELARIQLQEGNLREARTLAQRAVDLGRPADSARLLLGEVLLKLGLKKNAARELEAALAAGAGDRAKQLLRKC